MALLNSSIPNLLNGVSQQPDALKSPNQCEDQVNAYPSPVEGLIKRQPTEFVCDDLGADFNNTNTVDTSSFVINIDSNEQYLLTIKGTGTGALSVWDLNNNEEKDIFYDTDALPYLTATNSEKAFKFTTGGDVTFITNTEKTTRLNTERTSTAKTDAIVHVRQGAYSTDYVITINGAEYKHTTHGSSGGGHADEIQTDYIAQQLIDLLNDAVPAYRTDNAVTLGAGNDIDITNGAIDYTYYVGSYKKLRILVDSTAMADLAVGDIIQWENLGTSPVNGFKYSIAPNNGTAPIQHNFVVGDWFTVAAKADNGDGSNHYIELTRNGKNVLSPVVASASSADAAAVTGTGTGQLRAQVQTSATLTDFTFTKVDSTIYIENTAGDDFELTAQDSVGNTYMRAFKGSTQYFTDLPLECTDGFSIRIEGDAENDIDDYYVEFKVAGDSPFGEGTWRETVGNEQEFKYDYSTMPHILIKQTDGTFLFKPADGTVKPENITKSDPTTTFGIPTDQQISCFVDGATTSSTSVVIDGLQNGLKIKYQDSITVGAATHVIAADAEVENGQVTLQLEVAGTFADDTAVTLNIVSDYRPFKWADRKAGDSVTNPDPSFIGSTMNDIFFYENRLGFLSGENVILSESGEFFNFFRTTVINLLDTAPIDVTSSANTMANLRHAIPFKGNLILFSDQNQYVLGAGRQALTPKTVAMSQSSYFECNPNCTPTVAGASIFFPYKRGTYSGVKEMVIQNAEADVYDAFDITDHVPQYIPNEVRHLVSMPQENLLIALPEPTSGTMQDLYLYKYLDRGNKREQAAWFKYSFDLVGDDTDDEKQIIGIHVVDNTLYLVCQYRKIVGGSIQTFSYTYVYKMEIESGKSDDYSVFTTLLDSRVSYDGADGTGANKVVGTYDSGSNRTEFLLPFSVTSSETLVVVTKAHSGDAGGTVVTPVATLYGDADAKVYITGDVESNHYWFGKTYTMTYQYAKPVIKGQSRMGVGSVITSGRYQIHSADLVYADTHTFTATVNTTARNNYSYTFTADSNKAGITTQGSVTIDTGDFRVPIHAKNDSYTLTITSDSAFPVKLLSTEYEALFNSRSRRAGV